MKKYRIILGVLFVIAIILGFARWKQEKEVFIGKRIREDQIIAFRDSATVEFFYKLPEDRQPVKIQVEVIVGDGGSPITGQIDVAPGETVTLGETKTGEALTPFVSGIFPGRILVFDSAGKVIERVEPLECRIYESTKDPYDAVKAFDVPAHSFVPRESELHPSYHKMRISLDYYEIYTALYSLSTEDRNLNIEIYVIIENQELMIAKACDVGPNSICMFFYTDKSVTDMMIPDQNYSAHIKYYYSDSGELYIEEDGEFEILHTSGT